MRFISMISKPAGPFLVMNSKGGSGRAAPTLKTGALDRGPSWDCAIIHGRIDGLMQYIGRNPETATASVGLRQPRTGTVWSRSHKWRAVDTPLGRPLRQKRAAMGETERIQVIQSHTFLCDGQRFVEPLLLRELRVWGSASRYHVNGAPQNHVTLRRPPNYLRRRDLGPIRHTNPEGYSLPVAVVGTLTDACLSANGGFPTKMS